ncbi:MAG: SDR family NAD(P)-dependent oxidoreductase, partial [Novosphingobium sp.]
MSGIEAADLAGKVAVVTGGGGGIGGGIVRTLGERGVKVIATGRNPDKLARFAEMAGSDIALATLVADMTAEGAPK